MQIRPWPVLVAVTLTLASLAGCESVRIRHPEAPIERADIEAIGQQHFDRTRAKWILGPPSSTADGPEEGQCLTWSSVRVRDRSRPSATEVSDVRICFSATGYARSGSIGDKPLPD